MTEGQVKQGRVFTAEEANRMLPLVSAIMALGVNLQWGFAGLFNVGIMGFVALGGLAVVLTSMPPVGEAWAAGGARILGDFRCLGRGRQHRSCRQGAGSAATPRKRASCCARLVHRPQRG